MRFGFTPSSFVSRTLLASLPLAVACLGLCLAACRGDVGYADLVSDLKSAPTGTVSGAWVKVEGATCTRTDRAASGHVLFRLANERIYRIEARTSAVAEDLSHALDRLSTGGDGWVNGSADGEWLLIETSRFGCGDERCLAIVDQTLCTGQPVVAGGVPVRPRGYGAIATGGSLIVYPANGGAHPSDLFVLRRASDGSWTKPASITRDSPELYNQQPALSADGTRVLFDCGADPGSGTGTSICEVGTDGSGFRKVVEPSMGPGGQSANHHAGYGLDGRVVFEGSWNARAEQIWQALPETGIPSLLNAEKSSDDPWRFSDDNSPCVLPDGRVVSLWLGRAGNTGSGTNAGHEMKIMDADGTNAAMLLMGVDAVDLGIGCTL